jgi:hypothetical protein
MNLQLEILGRSMSERSVEDFAEFHVSFQFGVIAALTQVQRK